MSEIRPMHLPSLRLWRHQDWLSTNATVTTCEWKSSTCDRAGHAHLGHFCIHFTYTVDGVSYPGIAESPVTAAAGSSFPIRYNPRRPSQNSSETGTSFPISYLIATLLILAILYVLFEVRR